MKNSIYKAAYNISYHYSKHMRLLFVGINPHHGSDARGVPFSNNKMFWYLLSEAGFIEEDRTELKDDNKLKEMYDQRFNSEYDLGFINLIDRPTRDVSEIKKDEEKEGAKRLLGIVKGYKPKLVAFVGKVTYQKFSGKKAVDYGWQDDIYDSKAYVLHFPLRGKASIRVEELEKLKEYVAE